MRIGIVAEGTSDFILLEVVMQKIHGPHPIEFVRVWPDMTLTSRRGFGWRGVKNWCEEFGSQLSVFMQGVKGKELDFLVIHVDCSMADKVGAGRSCPPAKDTADALRDVVLHSWLGLTEAQPMLLIVTPAQSTDAWVVAALNPPYSRLASIECNKGVEAELVARHLLRKKDGEVKSPLDGTGRLPCEPRKCSSRCASIAPKRTASVKNSAPPQRSRSSAPLLNCEQNAIGRSGRCSGGSRDLRVCVTHVELQGPRG